MHIRLSSLVMFGSLLVLTSCAPKAQIESVRPSRYNLGQANQLVLVEVAGWPTGRESVSQSLYLAARARNWWTLHDQRHQNVGMRLSGSQARLTGIAPQKNHAYVRIDLYRFNDHWDGYKCTWSYNAEVGATVIDETGKPVMVEKQYRGSHVEDHSYEYRDVRKEKGDSYYIPPPQQSSNGVAEALHEALEEFLVEITPERVRSRVSLDDKADDLKPVMKMVKNRQIATAIRELETMQRRQAERADIAFNLGALTESLGQFEKALAYYDLALQLGPQDRYRKVRDACAQRIKDAAALRVK